MKKIFSMLVLGTALLSGCKTTEPNYYYGSYSDAVYSYFSNNEVTLPQQISILEEIIAQAQGKDKPIAPGIHAHLGMLYFESGNAEQGLAQFEQEKLLFPESTTFIDFLIANAQGASS